MKTSPLYTCTILPFTYSCAHTHTHVKGEDLERNDGSAARPYYMSSTLHEILFKDTGEPAVNSPSSPQDEEVPLRTHKASMEQD